MELGFKGKKVLVTGSTRGIGRAIASGFLEEGALVVITSRNNMELESVKNDLAKTFTAENILTCCCDVSVYEDVTNLVNRITEQWKGLDIVIANVGSGKSVPVPVPLRENFERVFNQNFTVAVNIAREFLPILEKSKGNMLFISSIAGIEAFGAPVDYSVAKSAVISLSKNIARKVAHKGVRINCIAPGNIYFDGGDWHKKMQEDPAKITNLIETTVPMQRFGKPEEIADAVLFICSERASFITGSVLCVDGGQTVSLF